MTMNSSPEDKSQSNQSSSTKKKSSSPGTWDHASLRSSSSHHRRHHHSTTCNSLHEPLKRTISTHGPPSVPSHVGINLYGDWNNQDSVNEVQVDPAIYDLDYDDVSDAGSDFTEDYSRHKLHDSGRHIDFDDESSMSSASSFADYDDDWSAASSSASSAADSRQLVRRRPSYEEQQLLEEDHTEFSVEEDPLLNASGALRSFDFPSLTTQPRPVREDDAWSDGNEEEEFDSWVPHKVWKETDKGGWLPQSDHAIVKPPSSADSDFRVSSVAPPRHASSASAESTDSIDSFAGDSTSDRQAVGIGDPAKVRKSVDSAQRVQSKVARPMIPLPPDPKLRIDDSDDEVDTTPRRDDAAKALSTHEEVLVFSDDEEHGEDSKSSTPATTNDSATQQQMPATQDETQALGVAALISRYSVGTSAAGRKGGGIQKKRPSKFQNPIVPTPTAPDTNILRQSSPRGHLENETPEDRFQYSMDFTQSLRISPTEHRVPLKDHSRRPQKNKNRKTPKKEKKSKKPKASVSNKKVVETFQIEQTEAVGVECIVPTGEEDSGDDCSVASEDSNDSIDAAAGNKRKQSKMSKKEAKKKKKKERERKRGRRADYEEDSSEADDTAHKVYAVADRVEAIFANKQMIFDTNIHDDALTSFISSKYGFELSKRERIRSTSTGEVSQPETILVRSKAAEEISETSKQRTEESTSRSKSKSRGRSVSKDRSKTNRSRSKSKDASSKAQSRSRSKSVKAGSKSRSRSKSGDSRGKLDRTKSDGALRRRLKKDTSGASSFQENQSLSAEIVDQKESKNSPKGKKPKVEKEKSSKSKSAKSPSKTASSPGQSNAITLQELMEEATDGEESLGQEQPQDQEELIVEGSSIDDIPFKIQGLQKHISYLEETTREEVEMLKKDVAEKKEWLRGKVMEEKERQNPIEAILCLHKMIANDYHASGRAFRKEMKLIEKEMTKQIARCMELTKESQELHSKTTAVVLKIQRMEFEKEMHIRTLGQCQAEHQQLLVQSGRSFSHESSVVIGGLEDYSLPSLVPLFQRWENPLTRDIPMEVLAATYKLPKSSIFYNILDDDDYKLTFTK